MGRGYLQEGAFTSTGRDPIHGFAGEARSIASMCERELIDERSAPHYWEFGAHFGLAITTAHRRTTPF